MSNGSGRPQYYQQKGKDLTLKLTDCKSQEQKQKEKKQSMDAHVCAEEKCQEEVVLLALNYMDRFLSTKSVRKTHLQILAAACLLLASKLREPSCRALSADLLVFYTDNSIHKADLINNKNNNNKKNKNNNDNNSELASANLNYSCCNPHIGIFEQQKGRNVFVRNFLSLTNPVQSLQKPVIYNEWALNCFLRPVLFDFRFCFFYTVTLQHTIQQFQRV
uniref:CYCLIN domain-containing protein n=1 Tax=Glossina austeni TaxID=7395 RepID=A0A1A9VSW3_GLOAU